MAIPSKIVSIWRLLVTLSIYSSFLLSHVVVVSGQCLSHQQSLLIQLKHSLVFGAESSTSLVQWNESSDCCTWPGVNCDHEGHVIDLNLRDEAISGGIDENSTLFNLVYLESLDLSYNYFNSTIPSVIGNLTNLRDLRLSYAGFVGQIPKEISHLTRLVTLDLSTSEYLQLLESSNLSMLVQNLTKLEYLYLDGVNILSVENDWAQDLSSSLPKLKVLSFGYCSPSDNTDKLLAKLNLRCFSRIQLDFNKSSDPSPRSFANFSNLVSFSTVDCTLHGMFPKEIFQVPTLNTLDISYNELLDGSLPEFPPNSTLSSLVITSTNFGGSLPVSIGNLGQLTKLDVGNCRFSGSLPKSITNLTNLVYLDLSSNNFTGPLPSFHMLKYLTDLHLSHNRFTGRIPLAHWEGFLELVNVDLRNNSLNGNIPSSMFSLPSVEMIDLSYNQFTGQVLEFPNASFSMLKTIDLSSNDLHGSLPMSIFKLTKIKHISLSSNKFNGTIQLDIIQDLKLLSSLDLSYTNLSVDASTGNSNSFSLPKFLADLRLASCKLGLFPDQIKNQRNMSYLDLSNNQIHGEIPNWIWKVGNGSDFFLNLSHNHLVGMQKPYSFSNVDTLDLSFNQLHGKIPILPPYPTYLDMSNNFFKSSIPSDIGNCLSRTRYLSLSNNNLTGVIPESICKASNMVLADLSNNSLSGRIPQCMLALSHIQGINLRSNKLSGPIPDALVVNCSLQILSLNGNLLTGRIPKSLANCRALEVLNLGNNQIFDTFPVLLKNISSLRILDLQANKFYGHITCPDSIGNWPVIQIVNIASNNFSGELPGQCLTTKWHAMVDTNFDFRETTPSYISYNYEDTVTVTNKGLEMELVKIFKDFCAIDFSSNNFHGEIPKELGLLKSLLLLNLSNNALTGHIPSSFGNLHQLESLDLSKNHLNGEIPASISDLNFLSFLDVSYNQLVGRIPKGNQIQTFSADRFEGNEGLCGPPLTPKCGDEGEDTQPETPDEDGHSNSGNGIKWELIGAEVGYIVGFGSVIGPLAFSRRWRKRYFDGVEDIVFSVLPKQLLKKWLSGKMRVQK